MTVNQTLHIACGQLVFRPGDIAHQLGQVEQLSADAARQGARMILFGEGALNGYTRTPEVMATAVAVEGTELAALQSISRAHGIVIVIGAFEKAGNARHVSQFIVHPNGDVQVQRKHKLTPGERSAGFLPGPEERLIFRVNGVRCAVSICADSGIPDLYNKLAAWGCQVSLHPCAGGGGRDAMCRVGDLQDHARRQRYLADMEKVCFVGKTLFTAAVHRMAIVAANLAGDDGVDHFHPGHSAIIDSRGCLVALQPGEYVLEFLRPLFIHGNVIVQEPRTHSAPPDASAPACCQNG